MLSEKLYRLMLRVYPESHRREYGELMVQLFRDRMRYHGHGINRFVIWIQTILDLVPSAYREHRNELDTIADVLERGSEYLDGLGSPRTAIALLATFLLMNSSVLLSSEGGVLEELLVVNSSLIGVGLLMWFCERPKTQVFLRRADRPLRISVGILSLLLLGGYVWITLENRLYEDPFTYLFPVAILPIALGLTLWIGKIRNRLFNGLWPPVFACWGLIGATALGPVLLHSPDPTPWVEIWGGILVVGLGFAMVVSIFYGMAFVVWRSGVKAGGATLRVLATRIRGLDYPYPPPNGSKGSGVADLELVGESAGSKCLDLMAKGV